jgi:acetylglutamate kinase
MTTTRPVDTGALQAKARVLHEALPWIRNFAGRTIVVKYGGNAMTDERLRDLFVEDVILLRTVGVDVVVVHGGGPEITAAMRELGKEPRFVDGQRVTDAEAIDVVRMVLVGRVNKDLVGRLNRGGRVAVGLSGEDGLLITARKRIDPGGHDLGFVGDVESVDPTALRALTGAGLVPVVAGVAAGPGGQPYNVNADAIAAALAGALGAAKVVYLTNVEGLYADADDPSSLIPRLDVGDLESMLASGAVHTGMVPKLAGIAAALRAGVGSASIIDGRLDHALLLELFTDEGVGTLFTTEPSS